MLVQLFEYTDGPRTQRCAVCFDAKQLLISVCRNSHWVCIECIERMICILSVRTSVFKSGLFTDSKTTTCPVCRQGHVFTLVFADINKPQMVGTVNLYCPRDQKPLVFRGTKYRNTVDAIAAWDSNPQFTYYCAHCDDFVVQTKDMPLVYIYERFRETCTTCPECGILLPYDQCFTHYYQIHRPRVNLKYVPTRFSRRLRNKQIKATQHI
jgi:hypothetical protein